MGKERREVRSDGIGEQIFISDGLYPDFKSMFGLGRNSDWNGLRMACEKELTDHPEWLTSYLFCADAERELGDKSKAKHYLEEFKSQKGDAYKDSPCPYLEERLKYLLEVSHD